MYDWWVKYMIDVRLAAGRETTYLWEMINIMSPSILYTEEINLDIITIPFWSYGIMSLNGLLKM